MSALLQNKLTNLTDMSKDLQIILTDIPKNLQIISIFLYISLFFSVFLRNSPIFSVFLRNSLHISFFLRIFAPAIPRAVHCIGENNLYKVLKNDAALPSEIDSRAFIVFFVTEILRFQIIFVTLRQNSKH